MENQNAVEVLVNDQVAFNLKICHKRATKLDRLLQRQLRQYMKNVAEERPIEDIRQSINSTVRENLSYREAIVDLQEQQKDQERRQEDIREEREHIADSLTHAYNVLSRIMESRLHDTDRNDSIMMWKRTIDDLQQTLNELAEQEARDLRKHRRRLRQIMSQTYY